MNEKATQSRIHKRRTPSQSPKSTGTFGISIHARLAELLPSLLEVQPKDHKEQKVSVFIANARV